MENNKYDVSDLVISAMEERPLDFENAFNDLIIDRISSAIHDKKVQIAQQMYGYNDDDADTDDYEEYSEEE
jgi:hypothetical protein